MDLKIELLASGPSGDLVNNLRLFYNISTFYNYKDSFADITTAHKLESYSTQNSI